MWMSVWMDIYIAHVLLCIFRCCVSPDSTESFRQGPCDPNLLKRAIPGKQKGTEEINEAGKEEKQIQNTFQSWLPLFSSTSVCQVSLAQTSERGHGNESFSGESHDIHPMHEGLGAVTVTVFSH